MHWPTGDDTDHFLAAVKDIINTWNWMAVFGICGGFTMLTFIMIGQFTPGDGFDMRDLVCRRDRVTKSGKIMWRLETEKFYKTGAFAFLTWALVWLVVNDHMTEMFLLIYAAAWIGNTAIDRLSNAKAGAMLSAAQVSPPIVVTPPPVAQADVAVDVDVQGQGQAC